MWTQYNVTSILIGCPKQDGRLFTETIWPTLFFRKTTWPTVFHNNLYMYINYQISSLKLLKYRSSYAIGQAIKLQCIHMNINYISSLATLLLYHTLLPLWLDIWTMALILAWTDFCTVILIQLIFLDIFAGMKINGFPTSSSWLT